MVVKLQINPEKDVETVKVDLKLSILEPIHAEVMTKIYYHFKNEESKTILSGWDLAGVIVAIQKGRSGGVTNFKNNSKN